MLKNFNNRNIFGSKFKKNPNNKRLRYTNKQILNEWIGDSILKFLSRLILAEQYPFMPVTLLVKREHLLLTNKGLRDYCKRHNLTNMGANSMERLLADKILNNNFNEAKEIVLDIWMHNEIIQQMDREELQDGKLSKEFISKQILHFSKKLEEAEKLQNPNEKKEFLVSNLRFYQKLHEENNVIS